jgi:hypothetical protein
MITSVVIPGHAKHEPGTQGIVERRVWPLGSGFALRAPRNDDSYSGAS